MNGLLVSALLFFSGLFVAALLANKQNLNRIDALENNKRFLVDHLQTYANALRERDEIAIQMQQRIQKQERAIRFLLDEMGMGLPDGVPAEYPPEEA